MMYYFAYGMNTNAQEMAWRCPAAEDLGTAYLDDHQMIFRHHADMVHAPGHTAPGVLWRITPACLAALDTLEGYPYYYLRRQVQVHTDNGTVPALMYYMAEDGSPANPSSGYYNLVLQGYNSHKISEKYLIEGLTDNSHFATIMA